MKLENPDTTRTAREGEKLPSPDLNRLGRVNLVRVDDPARHRSPWRLIFYQAGRERRKFFPTEKEALKFWANHKRIERKMGGLASRANPEDFFVIDRLRRKLPGVDLDAVADFYLEHRTRREGPALGEAVEQFLTRKRQLGRSDYHIRALTWRLRSLVARFGADARLDSFSKATLLKFVLSGGSEPRSVLNFATSLHNFFGYWVDQEAIPANPARFRKGDLPTVKPKRKIILSVAQARTFLACIQAEFPEYAAYFAIQAFTGMRESQAARLQPAYVDVAGRRIVVPAEICKTGDDWVLQGLPTVLWEWLGTAPVIAAPSNRQWGHIAGRLRQVSADLGGIDPWPINALRRSFCTYHISLHESAEKTAMILQHQDSRRLYKSYLSALRPKAEARAYFAISPASLAGHWNLCKHSPNTSANSAPTPN